MAEVIRYVDPDASGAANGTSWTDAYTSLSAAEAALDGGSNGGDDLTIYCRASAGTADTTFVDISGMTYDSVTIEAADGDQAVKTGLDATRYRLQTAVTTTMLTLSDSNVTVKGIQIDLQPGSRRGIAISGDGCTLDGVMVAVDNTYTTGYGIGVIGSSTTNTVHNCIVYGRGSNEMNQAGFLIDNGTANVYHSIVAHTAGFGFNVTADGAATITNVAVFDTADDFFVSGSATIDSCASDDGDGSNAVAADGGDWDNEYNDPANGDFTLLNTGNCYQGGASGTGVSLDIEGDSYDGSTPSIGVDEYVAAGGATLTVGDMAHAIAFDSPALTQKSTLVVGDMAHTMTFDAPALSQAISLVVADMVHAMSFDNISITSGVVLSVNDMAHAMSLDGPTLVSGSVLTVNNMGHTMSFDGVALTQKNVLAVADMMHAMGVDSVTLSMPGSVDGPVTITISGSSLTIGISGEALGVSMSGSSPTINITGE